MRLLLILLIMFSGIESVAARSYVDGLHFMKSPALAIQRQELKLGLQKISSIYTFQNNSNNNITETIVFSPPSENGLAIRVNDLPIGYSSVSRAINRNGIDISNILQELGLPLDPIKAMQIVDSSANQAFLREKLIAYKLIDQRDEEANWSLKNFYYWQQEFPANTTVKISYSYRPVTKASNLKLKGVTDILKMPINLVKKIFLHDGDLVNIQTLIEKHNPGIKYFCPKLSDYRNIDITNKIIPTREIYYEQQQEDLWASSIDEFNLTIESPDNMQPMLCWQGNLQKSKNNTLTFNARNYVPLQNIRVLYMQGRLDN